MGKKRGREALGEESGYSKIQRSMYDYGGGWVRGKLLGRGGFGSVSLAILPVATAITPRFRHCPHLLAVKSTKISSSDELTMEKHVYDSLGSTPHIIKCYAYDYTLPDHDDGHDEPILNVFLEYAHGGSLSSFIKRNTTAVSPRVSVGTRESQATPHTRSILRGLEFIHAQGYVHCDLKPANILLVHCDDDSPYGVDGFMAKIGDLGLAKKSNSTRRVRGTVMYMAPESVLKNVQEQASDIWALGCVVLQMLTGRPPWDKRLKKKALLLKIGTEKPALPKYLTPTARDFLEKCFSRNPNERPSAAMLLTHPFVMDQSVMKPQSDQQEFIPLALGDSNQEQQQLVSAAVLRCQIMPVALMQPHTQQTQI